ncbi:MAG: filamentous hemagglutinin N-terminal domain-containing protein [Phormidesmis sp.]
MLKRLSFWMLGAVTGLCCALPASAQTATPAVTATTGAGSVGTQVSGGQVSGAFTITGGSEQSSTLFHSFEDFSPQNVNVLFDLTNTQNTIERVINRVTGSSNSVINSQISISGNSGSPDFFLINPNGIIFGENASLSLPGAFIASTAEAVTFNTGQSFSAVNPTDAPMLSVSTPIGLQLGSTSADITVRGTGHSFTNGFGSAFTTSPTGLTVADGQNLGLVAANLTVSGGTLTASNGNVSLVAAGNAMLDVDVQDSSGQWQLRPEQTLTAGSIRFSERSLIATRGTQPGSVQLWANNLTMEDASIIWTENEGTQTGGAISLNIRDTIQFIGSLPTPLNVPGNGLLLSGLYAVTIGNGTGGDVTVNTGQLDLQEGGTIQALTRSAGNAGAVTVNADSINFSDSRSDAALGFIGNQSLFASGDSGPITINTRVLRLDEAGVIASASTAGAGNSNSIEINARERVQLTGSDTNIGDIIISASAVSPTGDAGDITINTPRLTLNEGALVSSSVFGAGQGGTVRVNATDRVLLQGSRVSPVRASVENSSIRASGVLLPEAARNNARSGGIFLPDEVTGNAGNVVINTANLILRDQGEVAALHNSTGDAGAVQINANQIKVDEGARLTASTVSGEGGNIEIRVNDLLSIRNGSQITAIAGGVGNGGNVSINAPVILGLENSDISADATQGNGGRISITTQGILGLEFRDEPTAESDITASSEFGVSGTVEINELTVDPSAALVELPKAPADADDQIAAACDVDGGNQFVASGRGGLPETPTQQIVSNRVWNDLRENSMQGILAQPVVASTTIAAHNTDSETAMTEATTWSRTDDGQLQLLAVVTAHVESSQANCLATMKHTLTPTLSSGLHG